MLGNSGAMRVKDDVQARRRSACLSAAEEFHEHALAIRRPFPNQIRNWANLTRDFTKKLQLFPKHPGGFLKKAAARPKMG